MKLNFQKIQLQTLKNDRATYTFNELKDYIDWKVERVYFVQDCAEATGAHFHFVENEFFIMAKGSAIALIDQGNGIEEIPLKGPCDTMVVGNHVWHGFKDFSDDALLLALSSTNYDATRSDYCEDYERYREILKDK